MKSVKTKLLQLSFVCSFVALSYWSYGELTPAQSPPRKPHRHIDHLPQQKAHSSLQLEVVNVATKSSGSLIRGIIKSRTPISERVYYKWVIPEGVPIQGLRLEGEFNGVPRGGESIDLDFGSYELEEGQHIILTAHFVRGGKKLGNSASLKLQSEDPDSQQLQKANSPKNPKIIF